MRETTDVAIIGAGPAGTIAAALLREQGHRVLILERAHFPRFSIGESLLPQCMTFIAEAGMAEAVASAGFQPKNGAAFARDGRYTTFDFRHKTSAGPGTTFQVERAKFDQLLAEQATAAGADIRFGHSLEDFSHTGDGTPSLQVTNDRGERLVVDCRFVLDASGFGRVLPRLLDLESPADFPVRASVFTHIEDRIDDPDYDRNKILIVVHPERRDVWYWLIPFSNGRCSLGAVAEAGFFDPDSPPEERLRKAVAASPDLTRLLGNARYDSPVKQIQGYAHSVCSLWGRDFALLGNAGEFLDPVFSSGVTIAMKSASLAAPLVSRQLGGEAVDWQKEYAEPLQLGIETFRTYVNAWYDGSFQDVIFSSRQQAQVRNMICSILAGYAWDTGNPFVQNPERLQTLVALCRD